ncbi:hypothetical protein DRQ50_13240, partial [bacterium]
MNRLLSAARSVWPVITLLGILLPAAAGTALAADAVLAEPDFDDARLLRMPDIHGDTVVFVYAGDLWTVSSQGGEARRLTSSVGYQLQPKFSPDGETIAFSGNYDGNDDVYLIPTRGGEPERLTWHPGFDRVIDWQPGGDAIRFQSRRATRTGRDQQLFTVPVGGGLPSRMALPTGGLSSYSPDGKRMAYNRISRENRTWKRYKGGMAQDVWIYDFEQNDTQKVTDWIGSDNFPMWHGDTVYYTSDKTGRLEIWAYGTVSGEVRQVTEHDEYDVKSPSLGPDAIVYENGGRLMVLDLATGDTRTLKVSLHADHVTARPVLKDVSNLIGSGDLAPDAKRAVFDARGDIFTVPAEKGNLRNLTATPGIRERAPVWSPDGKLVAYLGDGSGEYQVYLRNADGSGEEKQLTKKQMAWQYDLLWSPDNGHLLLSDASMNLWLIDVESGDLEKVDQGVSDDIVQVAWSHDSAWVAYAKSEQNGFNSIFLYEMGSGDVHRVTTDFTDDTAPCFDDEGKYLYFASARHFNPTLGGYDLKPVWANMDGLFVTTLRLDEDNPFPPESDEVEIKEDEEDGDDAKKEDEGEEEDGDEDADKDEDEEPLKIDLDGLADRMVALDVDPGNYYNLAHAGGKLFYMSRSFRPGGGRDQHGPGASIKFFDMEEREEKTVLAKAWGFTLSADGEKLLYAAAGTFGIIDAKPDQKPAEKPLRTGEMRARVDPRAEWRQMFRDAWRQERDFFYD